MKRSEPRTPELEIPRLLGAGVGAGSLNLPFELNICPECGWRLIEHNGLLVCERSRYTPEAEVREAAARRLSSLKGAPRAHAVPRAGWGNGAAERLGLGVVPSPPHIPAPAGRPPLVRGGIVRGEKKQNGTTPGPGRRVWKVRVDRVAKID